MALPYASARLAGPEVDAPSDCATIIAKMAVTAPSTKWKKTTYVATVHHHLVGSNALKTGVGTIVSTAVLASENRQASVVRARTCTEALVVETRLAAARTTERAYIIRVKTRRDVNAWKVSRATFVKRRCSVRKTASTEVPVPGRGVAFACPVLPETFARYRLIMTPKAPIPAHVALQSGRQRKWV